MDVCDWQPPSFPLLHKLKHSPDEHEQTGVCNHPHSGLLAMDGDTLKLLISLASFWNGKRYHGAGTLEGRWKEESTM